MRIAARCLHGACVCVIPHPDNNHRPLALRHGSLSFVSALLLGVKLVALGVVALTPHPAELSTITTARIVQLTNAERAQAGLNELVVNDLLSQAALQKAQNMLDEDYFAHISPTGVTPWFWMNKVGYQYRVAGENLAIDFTEAEDVVAAWMASPSHRDNVLHSSYVETGVAVLTGEFQGGTSTVVVHMFGLPASASTGTQAGVVSSPPPAETPATTPLPPTTPSPAAAPSSDTTPPPTPRIAFSNDISSVIRDRVPLVLTGEPGSTVYILARDTAKGAVKLGADGTHSYVVSVADLPDGPLSFQAYSRDTAGNESARSDAITITKDTQGPLLARQQVSFLLSPATDRQEALLSLANEDYASVTVASNGETLSTTSSPAPILVPASFAPLSISLYDSAGNATVLDDVRLDPGFYTERETTYLTPPARFSHVVRVFIAAVFALLVVLLLLAVVIRIRVQHPDLIGHGLFVLLIASFLFFL